MDDRKTATPPERPPVRQIIRDAVADLGNPTTNVKVTDWIEARYPGTNRGTINAQRLICTVNQPSRIHYPECKRPRHCDDHRYDFLYSPGRGQIEWYRPEKHGHWSIEKDDKGLFAIRCGEGELIYPEGGHKGKKVLLKERPRSASRTIPVTLQQIDAARVLHHKLPKWAGTDRAFERLRHHFDWDRESCILKAAAINDLYSTRVYAIWRMAEHLMNVMEDPPDDPAALVEKIASLPEDDVTIPRKHFWSFASKICHFFVNGDRYPIYDSFCRHIILYHLGRNLYSIDNDNPYRAFITNLNRLQEVSGLSVTLRDLDRYLWLTGQYREWLKKGDKAQTNSELRSLFDDDDKEVRRLLGILWTEKALSTRDQGNT